jgi:hypothetical protein
LAITEHDDVIGDRLIASTDLLRVEDVSWEKTDAAELIMTLKYLDGSTRDVLGVSMDDVSYIRSKMPLFSGWIDGGYQEHVVMESTAAERAYKNSHPSTAFSWLSTAEEGHMRDCARPCEQ